MALCTDCIAIIHSTYNTVPALRNRIILQSYYHSIVVGRGMDCFNNLTKYGLDFGDQ